MIRELGKADVPQIVELAAIMAEETGHRLHVERTGFILSEIIEHANVFAWGDVDDGGRLRAMFIGEVSEHPFFNAVFAQELAIYSHPDFRGGTAGARLIKKFTEWATEKNVDWIKVEITAGVHNDRALGLFEKFGYQRGGVMAFQGVRRDAWPQQP